MIFTGFIEKCSHNKEGSIFMVKNNRLYCTMYNGTYEYNRLNEIRDKLAMIQILPHKKGDCQNDGLGLLLIFGKKEA